MSRTLLFACVVPLLLPAWAMAQAAPIPVILDTDIGDDIDDAFALALALASPELEVRGVTTAYGDAFTRAQIVCRFLHAVDRPKVPVASGKPPREKPSIQGQMQYGLRPLRLRPEKQLAAEFIYQRLKAEPGQITLLAVGPLGNVAELFTKYPDSKPLLKRLVIMGGSVRVGYDGKDRPDAEWNIKADVQAAQTVFASGVPLVVAPLDATGILRMTKQRLQALFPSNQPLLQELYSLYQLWDQPEPILFDPVAVTLCFTEKFCTMEDLALMVDDQGMTRIAKGKTNARVATSIKKDAFLDWYATQVAGAAAASETYKPHRVPLTNLSKPIQQGTMPARVHAIEDYETDIERRWWLAGKLETKNLPPDSQRACRGVWTNDFDGQMGDAKARYTAVIFNPVPGPPMGPATRLSFRCWLKGSGRLRVQLYTLSKGYHRHLTLDNLPTEKWLALTVDMTQMRRPDGSGGALAEDERIDDIQFYTGADNELLIDDIVLHEEGAADEKLPFPRRSIFTGWFDTGKQGKEWPGAFEIVAKIKPHTWKAAKSVAPPQGKEEWLVVGLRGARPLAARTKLRLHYLLAGPESFTVSLRDAKGKTSPAYALPVLGGANNAVKTQAWRRAVFDLAGHGLTSATEIIFQAPRGQAGHLLVDDVFLHE